MVWVLGRINCAKLAIGGIVKMQMKKIEFDKATLSLFGKSRNIQKARNAWMLIS